MGSRRSCTISGRIGSKLWITKATQWSGGSDLATSVRGTNRAADPFQINTVNGTNSSGIIFVLWIIRSMGTPYPSGQSVEQEDLVGDSTSRCYSCVNHGRNKLVRSCGFAGCCGVSVKANAVQCLLSIPGS
jgi:hypothetical protein